MTATRYPQFCALARAAEVLGERWTLLIVRELLIGPKRFGELSERLDSVSPTLLTARLNNLVENGVVRRASLPAAHSASVYELTKLGERLRPAIHELIRWGGHFMFPMQAGDRFNPDWALLGLEAILRRDATRAHKIVLRVRHESGTASFLVSGGPDGARIEKSEGPGGAAIEAGFDVLLKIIAGALSLDDAVSKGLATVEGSLNVARALPKMFDLKGRS
jgi:DNA-binding HxlR family transcriptional regulator